MPAAVLQFEKSKDMKKSRSKSKQELEAEEDEEESEEEAEEESSAYILQVTVDEVDIDWFISFIVENKLQTQNSKLWKYRLNWFSIFNFVTDLDPKSNWRTLVRIVSIYYEPCPVQAPTRKNSKWSVVEVASNRVVALDGEGPYRIYTHEGYDVVGCSDEEEGEYCMNLFPEIEPVKKKKRSDQPVVARTPPTPVPVVSKAPAASHGSTRPTLLAGMTRDQQGGVPDVTQIVTVTNDNRKCNIRILVRYCVCFHVCYWALRIVTLWWWCLVLCVFWFSFCHCHQLMMSRLCQKETVSTSCSS